MNSLPPEVLHNIFIQVPLKQRLTCMYVCRQWCALLRGRSLLYDIEIRNEDQLANLIDFIQCFTKRASQVEILNLVGVFEKTFDHRKFLNMFPNLRAFKFNESTAAGLPRNFFSKPFELAYPDSKLEEIWDEHGCELARQLITSGSCTRLRRLHLQLSRIKTCKQDIYPYLKNMPALRKLSMRFFDLGIQDCELLLSNLPSLESLHLECVYLGVGELPNYIEPATSVTELHFQPTHCGEKYPNWYIYMARKFTHLLNFVCEDQELGRIDLDQSLTIYRDGLIPIYKTLGKHLTSLSRLKVPHQVDLFNHLDHFDCQIKTCHITNNESTPVFTQLGQSNQAKYLQVLRLENTVLTMPSLLQNMSSLTELKILPEYYEGTCWPINLTDYLNAFPPSLIKFSARCSDLEITSVPTRSNNIQKFTLFCPKISKLLCQAVSACFPKLIKLSIQGRLTENATIDLPNHHLEKLCLSDCFKDEPHGFLITHTSDPQTSYYLPQHQLFQAQLDPPPTDQELQDRITLRVICASVESFDISVPVESDDDPSDDDSSGDDSSNDNSNDDSEDDSEYDSE